MPIFSTLTGSRARRVISALTLAFIPAMAFAVDDALVVTYKNSQTFSYVLADRPNVTFDGTQLFIKSDVFDDTHSMADIKTFTFADLSEISDVAADERRIVFTDAASVTLEGFAAGTAVSVSDMSGRVVISSAVAADSTATIDISQLPAGVYVIATADGKSYKILKR